MPDVLIVHDDPEQVRPFVEADFPDLSFHYATDEKSLGRALSELHPIAALSIKCPALPGPLHRQLLELDSIRWIHVGGSGFDHLLPLERERLLVTNSQGVLSRFLAENVISAMGALNGNLLRYAEQAKSKIWQPIPFSPLADKTLLVVGIGAIGSYVAKFAKALGMRVIATKRTPADLTFVDQVYPQQALPDVVSQADFVSLHVRLNDETRHLFDREMFARMRAGSFLINTSRGSVVHESALVDALQSEHLAGAYLDVFETEPLPHESPLWTMPNVLITPHAADQIADWPCRFSALFAENLHCFLNDRPMINTVYAAD